MVLDDFIGLLDAELPQRLCNLDLFEEYDSALKEAQTARIPWKLFNTQFPRMRALSIATRLTPNGLSWTSENGENFEEKFQHELDAPRNVHSTILAKLSEDLACWWFPDLACLCISFHRLVNLGGEGEQQLLAALTSELENCLFARLYFANVQSSLKRGLPLLMSVLKPW